LLVIPEGNLRFARITKATSGGKRHKAHVISTEGGAFAAAVERPLYLALASFHPNHPRDSRSIRLLGTSL